MYNRNNLLRQGEKSNFQKKFMTADEKKGIMILIQLQMILTVAENKSGWVILLMESLAAVE